MRYMMFVKLSADGTADYASDLDPEDVARMQRYNEELTKAGVLLALDGLHPMSEGARVGFSGGRGTVLDGPYTEVKELIGGYWIIQVSSKEEAIEWARRCPMDDGDVIEVRRVYELGDHPQEIRDAARLSKEPPRQTFA
jgi:hypothetical protein